MSSNIFPNLGQFIGKTFLGPIGGAIGREFDKEFSHHKKAARIGPRLKEYTLQTAEYGKSIAIIYGKVKLAGNIIWASKIKEHREDHYQKRSKFGGTSLVASNFNYSISLAIAIAEGEIDEILRVWANDKLINPKQANYRFYKGTEDQLPDPLIEATFGYGKTPAFRGLAYVVIEDLSLGEFGNHIPNFIFEVRKSLKPNVKEQEIPLEERVKAMVIIPGSGEFVYDTIIQSKVPKNYNPKYGNFNFSKSKINQNNRDNQSDAIVSLNQLASTCPNLEWAAPVVGWFCTSLNPAIAKILPGVEYNESETIPDKWKVASFTRDNAHQISKNKFFSPIYGGTTNDLSVLRYLEALRAKKYNIMFYPMIFIDRLDKPWRGRISGTAEEVKNFFYGEQGYFKFILHYANLVKDKVDAFIIGSELIGLTQIKAKDNSFPAVDALLDLAKKVKEIMGPKVKISYAADWSEYHHSKGGWYNLDPLWSSPDIDFIGIDAYFPLTNETENFVGEDKIIKGWQSGEGYDYIYENKEKTKQKKISPQYAWKNIKFWWENEHINPDGKKTSWQPKSKKIWFTELGFPSVDLCTNQPNLFYGPDSIESAFPIHSQGKVDFFSQRQALSATEKFWDKSEIVENIFLWCWDARPYPYWPDLTKVWSDGGNWSRGHWLSGKLGKVSLQSLLLDLTKRAGIDNNFIKAEQLNDIVDGLIIAHHETAIDAINFLKEAYFFDSYEQDGNLEFVKKANGNIYNINYSELCYDKDNFKIFSKDYSERVHLIEVAYFNSLNDYNLAIEISNNYAAENEKKETISLPLVIDQLRAKNIAEINFFERYYGEYIFVLTLSIDYLHILPNDILRLNFNDQEYILRILKREITPEKTLKIFTMTTCPTIYHYSSFATLEQRSILLDKDLVDPGYSEIIFLDLPKLPYDIFNGIYIGVIGGDKDWHGADVYCPDNSILNFDKEVIHGIIDQRNDKEIIVQIFNGELFSVNDDDFGYKNIAVIGKELIHFKEAEFLGDNRYCLREISNNLFSTPKDLAKNFVIFDNSFQKFPITNNNITHEFYIISHGHDIDQKKKFIFKK